MADAQHLSNRSNDGIDAAHYEVKRRTYRMAGHLQASSRSQENKGIDQLA